MPFQLAQPPNHYRIVNNAVIDACGIAFGADCTTHRWPALPSLGLPPDAFQNGDYAFFDAENNAGRILGNYAAILMLLWPILGGLCRNFKRYWVQLAQELHATLQELCLLQNLLYRPVHRRGDPLSHFIER